ncbi:AraC family transcriptional regulator [Erwinia sp. OLTSP20]|uniref:AraC family transcriptional regulator n=1 Tax=unclassified Erwinia TaxID=2622719 RepID=UPI000C197595|nr:MULTISPECIES: helix-turn-helix transcriptional regulator [unclassified Erwinia]PIJ51513.1 AraC family transcriptional regulator [Erwinia sp. OAMSP11]PIJ75900.1 AraC family transcriptional regulator [Erwinia sp. OLSSP12]PIJ83424.1 AraC family transcriptional regulator [Erwinia sp. OLCASP19]PIJ86257.1 AraC family transcriptional regulator [Erwinia sp. OLMTSP26]PIJ88500.1 AraC family transcriptional regulator [Erwinia sp. OLMDSP33]
MHQQRTFHAARAEEAKTVFFRYERANAQTEYLPHCHPWGQVIFVRENILEIFIAGQRLLTPAGYPVWVPPAMEHASYNRKQAHFRTFNLPAGLCSAMPSYPCLLKVSAVVMAIMDECSARHLLMPVTPEEQRLCQVLCDQLLRASPQNSYLPTSQDKLLAPVLAALEAHPGDNTTLAQWAKRVFTTERTLARRCQSELAMGFSEWRQRLRFLHAIALLEQGLTVQETALELGYSSASALIVMFQQQAGTTPERYRGQGQKEREQPLSDG